MHRITLLFLLVLLQMSCSGEGGSGDTQNDSVPVPPRDSVLVEDETDFQQLAQSYESPDREDWQKPDLLVASLGDLSNKTVADLGSGTGYFTFRLAEKARKVIAIDIDQRFLDYIDRRQEKDKQQGISNIETRLTSPTDISLKPGEADIVFTVNTYHYISDRSVYFARVKQALPPGGKLVVVDFRDGDIPVGPREEEKINADVVVKELTAAGFSNISIDLKMLPYQFVLTAE